MRLCSRPNTVGGSGNSDKSHTKTNMARRGRGNIVIEAPEEEKKNEISFLQPEILPVHLMEGILRQRGFSATVLHKADRKDVVKYFYKHISPKFQREYRDNRRGKILKKIRQRRERKIVEEDWKSMLIDSKGKNSILQYSSSSRDRLEPPPSSKSKSSSSSFDKIMINDHKSRSNQSESKSSKSLDDIVIKDHKVRSHSSDSKDSRKESDKKRDSDEGSDRDHKKIKLSSSSEKRHSESESSGSGKKVKLHRTSLQWP